MSDLVAQLWIKWLCSEVACVLVRVFCTLSFLHVNTACTQNEKVQTMLKYINHIQTHFTRNWNKVFSVNSVSQPTWSDSVDRFITFCLMTSATTIPGVCRNQSPLGDPNYVTGSICLQAFDTGKRMAAAAAEIDGQRQINHNICHDTIWMFEATVDDDLIRDNGHIGGGMADAACTIMWVMTSHAYSIQKTERSKRCRL